MSLASTTSDRPLDFDWFKASRPAKAVFRSLGVIEILDISTSWAMLRRLVIDYNDPDKGLFVEAARNYDGVASSGERVLLHAILYAMDFAWLADELDNGRTWQRMDRVDGEWRQAVAACIAAHF